MGEENIVIKVTAPSLRCACAAPPPKDPPSSITAIVLARHPPLFFILSTKVERSATSPRAQQGEFC